MPVVNSPIGKLFGKERHPKHVPEGEHESMLGELVPCGGGDPIPLLQPKLLVGRRSTCDVCLRFSNVSSHHCELELREGYWRVRDLNSRNGIKVNGIRYRCKWLMPGDVLSIVNYRYELRYTPQGDRPPPDEEDPFATGLLEKAGLARARAGKKSSASKAPRSSDEKASDRGTKTNQAREPRSQDEQSS